MFQRVLTIALMSSVLIAPLAAQKLDTLKVRVDRSTNAQDPDDAPDLKTVAMGKGVRVTGGPAGTFWNAADAATGNYTVKATFQVRHRSGDLAMTVGSVSKHAAIATPDATGKSTNTLEVRVAGNMISY